MKNAIRAHIEEEFLVQFGGELADDTDLFKAGIIDSFGYVRLIGFLQDTFGVSFGDEELLTNVMISVDRMADAIAAKLGQGAAR